MVFKIFCFLLFTAIKNLGEKAEGILEEQKKKVEELAVEKKNAAAALLEQQVSKLIVSYLTEIE